MTYCDFSSAHFRTGMRRWCRCVRGCAILARSVSPHKRRLATGNKLSRPGKTRCPATRRCRSAENQRKKAKENPWKHYVSRDVVEISGIEPLTA